MNQSRVPGTRAEAAEADHLDPLARFKDEFLISRGGPIYLDGNSLGRQPRATTRVLGHWLEEWPDLVGGWEHWVELPTAVGDRVGQLVGAAPGQGSSATPPRSTSTSWRWRRSTPEPAGP